MNNYIGLKDVILIVLYFVVILFVGFLFSRKIKAEIRGYFRKALLLKLLCGLSFAWVYAYYYGGGDTQMYFNGASSFYKAFISGHVGLSGLSDPDLLLGGSKTTIFTKQVTSIINLFSFNSFWSCTLLFAALSLIGLWLLFISFYRLFPTLHKQLAIVTLFIPGVVFWSSGIMKDTLCVLFIGVIVWTVQNLFSLNRKKIITFFLLLLSFYVIINLKAYIALVLLVSLALYTLLAIRSNIKNVIFRIMVVPFATVVIFSVAFFFINEIGEYLQRFSLENIAETAQTYQEYHSRISVAGRGSENRTGSAYSLGDINFSSPASVASKVPQAINVTYFRPYVWEVKNPVMLLSALESFLILLFTLKVLFKTGIFKFIRHIFFDKEIIFCMAFAMMFGFAVGFTSYNFGSLVRYKAPCVPFYLIALVLINALPKKKQVAELKYVVSQSSTLPTKEPQPFLMKNL
ncbi:MAG: hypothetical protein ABIR81_00900 [Ginsengibacter sp.]